MPPVSDEVLHLLYRGGADEPRFTATLHEWIDREALLEAIPDSVRKTGFGGVGFLVDALRDAAQDPGVVHQVSSVRIGGWDRYRIDVTRQTEATHTRSGPGQDGHRGSRTDACDGRRRWQVYKDRVVETPAAPLPDEVPRPRGRFVAARRGAVRRGGDHGWRASRVPRRRARPCTGTRGRC